MGARKDMEKRDANLHPNVKKVREIFITDHAYYRIRKRVRNYHKNNLYEHIINSLEKGKKPPKGFKKNKADKPKEEYDSFKYKYFIGYIWIWGIRRKEGYTEKHLITVYNWQNSDHQTVNMGRSNLGKTLGKNIRRNVKWKARKYQR